MLTEVKVVSETRYSWEHGNIRYAPRGLREQHEDVVGIYRS